MIMNTLRISVEYMTRDDREHQRGTHGVFLWVIDYCRRNNIPYVQIYVPEGRFTRVENDTPYIEMSFKSLHQRNIFARRGNHEWPYFEFI
jgi:hypothetical protein